MQKIFLFISLAIISISLRGERTRHSCNEGGINYAKQTTEVTESKKDLAFWNKMAEGMSRALIDHFWGAKFAGYPDRYYFNYGSDLSNMATNHYWPQAHAMDVVVDAYLRTSNQYFMAAIGTRHQHWVKQWHLHHSCPVVCSWRPCVYSNLYHNHCYLTYPSHPYFRL